MRGHRLLLILGVGALSPIRLLVPKACKQRAELIWRTTTDAQSVELLRSPGLNGETGGAQTVVVRAPGAKAAVDVARRRHLPRRDEAANKSTRKLEFVARGALLFPAPGERVTTPPLLVWTAVRGASYYNVVLVRGRRVFSAWPPRARLKLPRAWTYHGGRYKLRPGRYRWYVWPGRGRLAAGRYGKLLGASSFVVSR